MICFNILTEDGICSRGTTNMVQINKLSGGKDPLNFFLNGVSTPLELSKSTAMSSGKYLLEIFDANHCKYSKEFKKCVKYITNKYKFGFCTTCMIKK